MGSPWDLITIFWLRDWKIDLGRFSDRVWRTILYDWLNIWNYHPKVPSNTKFQENQLGVLCRHSHWKLCYLKLKNFTDPYTFSDFKCHFIWPEYYNQWFDDKTDHLEWEVSDAGLTILNGKSLRLDYYILVGLLKYRFWISDTSISWPSLIMIYA